MRHIDTTTWLQPFLDVIASDTTDAHVTNIALHVRLAYSTRISLNRLPLQSVHKFLVYGLVNHESPQVAEAVRMHDLPCARALSVS